MSDIIREVDEELRRERLANIWKKYGGLIVFAVFLVVTATAGWRGYEYYAERQAEAASERYAAAQKLAADAAKTDEAIAAFNAIAPTLPQPTGCLRASRPLPNSATRIPRRGPPLSKPSRTTHRSSN